MADLPDRRKRIHITRPWLHASHNLVLRAGSVTPDPGFAGSIALFKLPIHIRLARKAFPHARLVELADHREIVREVCRGGVAAGFLEERAALAALREKPAECASMALRITTLPDLTLQLGVASTFKAAGAADKIRSEIGSLFRDGTLAATIAKYSYYGIDDTWTTYDLLEAAERARWLAWGIGGLGIALAVMVWQAASMRQRKQSEVALRESEERFRAIFSQAAVGISQTSFDGVWLRVNDRFCEMLGYAETELRGKQFQDVTHPEDVETSRRAMRGLLAGEMLSWQADKRYIRKDGTILWARVFVSLVRDQNSEPQYFICAVEDVTDRVRADRARQDSERRLTLAENVAHVGVWECDLRTKTITTSREFVRLRGLPPDSPPLSYEEWLGFVHADDRESVRVRMKESIGKKQSWDNEFRVVWPDGSIHWLMSKGTVFADDSGKPVGLAGVNLDITERKLAEGALAESEARFRNLADTAQVMIWVSGPDKLCTFFNRGWLTFTGSTMDQAVGNGWSEKVHPDDRDRCHKNYSAAFDDRRTFQTECRLRRADGEYRWVLATGTPRFESSGTFAGYVGSCTDITDLKRSQDEALARQKLESLGVLAGGIAHDFNNLLGGILASVEFILGERDEALPAGKEELLRIRTAAFRGAEIVRQLMIYGGEESQRFEAVDMIRLVSEMLQLLKVSISKRAILEVNLPESVPAVRANAAQMRQVVMNLITNASESLGEKDGVISITVAQVRSDADCGVADLSQGDYLRLEVGDTGCGMREEIVAKIFDPFFTTKFAGRGLGLAAVQGIVRSHGGTIKIVSAPGRGSRFEIMLPCSSESPRDSRDMEASTATRVYSGSITGTVLVVEDEDTLRLAVSKMLRRAAFAVIEAADGKTGVNLFRAKSPEIDAVLLDMTLPGMSGREVLAELRRIQPNVKVIITSAYSQEWAVTTIGGQQSWLYIRKPYDFSVLMGLLRNVCLNELRMSDHVTD